MTYVLRSAFKVSISLLTNYYYQYIYIYISLLTFYSTKKKKYLYLFQDWKMSILLSSFFYHKFTTHFQFLLNHISSFNSTIKILRNYFILFLLFYI